VSLGSGAHVIEAITLDELVSASVQRETLLATAGGTLAAVALLIATIGIFGFLTFAVSSRRWEIAVRAALGAAPESLTRLVLGRVLRPMAIGLCLGFVAAVYAIRLAGSLLFGLGLLDVPLFVGTTIIFIVAAAVAAVLPVRAAVAVDPASVFRA
jgi:putative ABC transport system permease protein